MFPVHWNLNLTIIFANFVAKRFYDGKRLLLDTPDGFYLERDAVLQILDNRGYRF